MNRRGDERAVRPRHESAKLCEYSDLHSGRYDDFFVSLFYALCNGVNVVCFLLRAIGYADAAGEIDELYFCACFVLEFDSRFKEYACENGVIFVGYRIAREECVQTEVFCAE